MTRHFNMTSNKSIKHYSLSSPQRDIWFDQILHLNVSLYNWQDKYREVPEPLLVRHYAAQFKGKTVPSERSTLRLKRYFYNQLIDFAKENKDSTFHVILGTLYCYFVRTCDREDFFIGLPTLNRSRAAFKQTMGLFVGVSPAKFCFGLDLNFIFWFPRAGAHRYT